MSEERLSEETCRSFLSAAQLIELCRARGFTPPRTDKDSLVAFVTPRLPEAFGVEGVMASLDEDALLVLHRIAMEQRPPAFRALRALLQGTRFSARGEDRERFKKLADELLSRGVLLVQDTVEKASSSESRYARLAFCLPAAHRPLLPPFPLRTEPLRARPGVGVPLSFLRKALSLAAQKANTARPGEQPQRLFDRISALFSFGGGRIWFDGGEPSVKALLERLSLEWTRAPRSIDFRVREAVVEYRLAAAYVLSHLPAGRACTVEALAEGLVRLKLPGQEWGREGLTGLCEEGYQAGFLSRGEGKEPCYAASRLEAEDGPLRYTVEEKGLLVDLDQTGLAPLLDLALLSRVEPTRSGLLLLPDIRRLGAKQEWLSSPLCAELRRASTAFEEAARHVEERRGKLFVHQGLAVLKVEDLGLRALLAQRLGAEIRPLSGSYFAVPRGALKKLEELAKKEGFSPRKISS
jgi:hypothetical protein